MQTRRSIGWITMLASALAFGCASGTDTGDTESTGSLSLQLVLSNGENVNQVEWVITRGGMEPMNGTIDTSAPGATASVEVFGLEAGDGYRITMTAQAEGSETRCTGATDFSVSVGDATEIMVVLRCKGPPRFGAVRVDGKFNVCAELTKMVVAPLQTSVGNSIDLSAAGEDAERDDIVIRWTAEGGVLGAGTGEENQFTCESEGEGSVTAEVSDDGFDACVSGWTVQVTCVAAASVRVAHLAPEIPTPEDTAVDIFINGERSAITGLTFGMATPFVELPPGAYEFGIAPAGGEPIFSFPAALGSGSITTVVAIRTATTAGAENPVNVLVFNGDLSGLGEGQGRVLVGHGADETAVSTVDVIDVNECPPALFSDLMFGTVQGPTDFAVDVYETALAVPSSCEPIVAGPGTGVVAAPVSPGIASLFVVVDLNTTDLEADPTAYALFGDASGEIPTLPGVGGAGGAGGAAGAGGAGGEGGTGGMPGPCIPTPGISADLPRTGDATKTYADAGNGFTISAPVGFVNFSAFGIGATAAGSASGFEANDRLVIEFFDAMGAPSTASNISVGLSSAGVAGNIEVIVDDGTPSAPTPVSPGGSIDVPVTGAQKVEIRGPEGDPVRIYWVNLSFDHDCL